MHCAIDSPTRQHANDEASVMMIAEKISTRVSALTAKNGEFYPFKQEHISAFLADMLPHQVTMMQVALVTPGADLTPMLNNWIYCYWQKVAEDFAIKEMVDSHE